MTEEFLSRDARTLYGAGMSGEAEIWVIKRERKILVQTPPMGPPMSCCTVDKKSSQKRGYVAIGDVYIEEGAMLGCFPVPDFGWGKAGEVAQAKAKELGFQVEYYDHFAPRYAEDWDDL